MGETKSTNKYEERIMQKQQNSKRLLFVYGSLKRGFDNHSMLKGATYAGEAKTLQPYSMFVETHGQYPYLLKNRPFHQIEGELYEIESDELWKRIDEFEGVPDYYSRETIIVVADAKHYQAQAYFFVEEKIPQKQEPLKVWTMNNNYFLDAFEEYYRKSV